MEVLIGFAVGYWMGTRHGRKGFEDALDTAREAWQSPMAQRLLEDGLSVLQTVKPVSDAIQKSRRDTRSALIHGVIDEIIERRSARQAPRAA
jgi:hypothetical protein